MGINITRHEIQRHDMQAWWRGVNTRRKVRQAWAVSVLQRHARGFLLRVAIARQTAAALAIQKAWRRHAALQRFCQLQAMALSERQRAAAVCIQTAWRSSSARRAFVCLRAAALICQAYARQAAAQRLLDHHCGAVICIQVGVHILKYWKPRSSGYGLYMRALAQCIHCAKASA